MSFTNLMTNRVVVGRLTVLSGDKSVYATITSEYCCIQRMSDRKTVEIGGAIGKMFRLYADDGADIEKGDKLVETTTGEEYKVVSVSIPAELGAFQHMECIINRVK